MDTNIIPGLRPESPDRKLESSSLRSQATAKTAGATNRIFLTGFMGAGKTTVGRALADNLGWRFADLDDVIEALEGRTVAEIFRASGEAVFRDAEYAALIHILHASQTENVVVALGGGAFLSSRNALLIKQPGGTIIFLDAPPEELFDRCHAQNVTRPLRQDLEQFRALYDSRRSTYLISDLHIVTVGRTIDSIVKQIADAVRDSDQPI